MKTLYESILGVTPETLAKGADGLVKDHYSILGIYEDNEDMFDMLDANVKVLHSYRFLKIEELQKYIDKEYPGAQRKLKNLAWSTPVVDKIIKPICVLVLHQNALGWAQNFAASLRRFMKPGYSVGKIEENVSRTTGAHFTLFEIKAPENEGSIEIQINLSPRKNKNIHI